MATFDVQVSGGAEETGTKMCPIILSAEESENHLFGILFVGGTLERSMILSLPFCQFRQTQILMAWEKLGQIEGK